MPLLVNTTVDDATIIRYQSVEQLPWTWKSLALQPQVEQAPQRIL